MGLTRSGSAPGGPPPFGYHRADSGSLTPNPAEAPIRLLLCELFLEHRRTRTVAQVLNDRGHRTRGGSRFSDTTVLRLLREPAPNIVPADLFQRCAAILDERADGNRPGKRPVHLFAGLIVCVCGSKLTVPSSSQGKYVCPSCLAVKVPADILDEAFVGELERTLLAGKLTDELPDLRELRTHWPSFSFAERRSIVEQLVDRVEVSDGTITFHIYDISPSGEDAAVGQRTVARVEKPGAQLAQTEPTPPPVRTASPSPVGNTALGNVPLDQLLTRKQLKGLVPISNMTLWRWMKKGEFPEPIRRNGRTYWRASEVQAWIEAQSKDGGAG